MPFYRTVQFVGGHRCAASKRRVAAWKPPPRRSCWPSSGDLGKSIMVQKISAKNWGQTPYVGDGHLTFNGNPYNGYINPYYWVDEFIPYYMEMMGV